MRLINVDTLQLEEFFHDIVPPYAILSHTWSADNDEISFQDVQNENINKAGIGYTKLQGCCQQAKRDKLGYVWIDTCCIDKKNSVELGEAINSMFRWYRNAAAGYAYLSDVPAGEHPLNQGSSFHSSRWFTRGWTLQELLAPSRLEFYGSGWDLLGTKRSLSPIIERITGVPRPFLLGIESLRDASIAQRLSWAANRVTKRTEDIAYCLLGIFDVTLPMIYGEGDQAFSRLQHAIMRDIGDDSILAWGLVPTEPSPAKSAAILSAGALAASPKDFANCGHIVSRKHYATPRDSITVVGGYLRVCLLVTTTPAGEKLGLLNCGPKRDTAQVVGIPLSASGPREAPDEYVRPQGHHPVLLPAAGSRSSASFIYIPMERQRSGPANDSQNWFYIEPSVDTQLELIEVEPPGCWQRDLSLIATETDGASGNIEQPKLARFRPRQGSRDFLVALEFVMSESRLRPRCHVMVCSREIDLGQLHQRLPYLRPESFGKRAAHDGTLTILVTVESETIGQQQMFAVKLHAIDEPPFYTTDADFELKLILERLDLVKQLRFADQARWEAEELAFKRREKEAELGVMETRLAEVNEEIKRLTIKGQLWTKRMAFLKEDVGGIAVRHDEIKQQQDELSEGLSRTRRQLEDTGPSSLHGTSLANEYTRVVRLFLKEANIVLKDGQTPLSWASEQRHESIMDLLGAVANPEAMDSGPTTVTIQYLSATEGGTPVRINQGRAVERVHRHSEQRASPSDSPAARNYVARANYPPGPGKTRGPSPMALNEAELELGKAKNTKSSRSYTSATEKPNVMRPRIEVEIDRNSHRHRTTSPPIQSNRSLFSADPGVLSPNLGPTYNR